MGKPKNLNLNDFVWGLYREFGAENEGLYSPEDYVVARRKYVRYKTEEYWVAFCKDNYVVEGVQRR